MPKEIRVINWRIGDAALDQSVRLVAAIGNLDGVHLGHQSLIGCAASVAGERANGADSLKPAVITFTPHPKRFFKPDMEGFLLADPGDKLCFLADAGAEVIIQLQFDEAMRNTSAHDFIHAVLPALGIDVLCAGEDFAFGNDRIGNLDMVTRQEAASGIRAVSVPILDEGGLAVSSSRIRAALKEGNVSDASTMLGRPFTVSGTVIEGDRRGRTIGFPTANITMGEMQQPDFGVYSVAVRLADQPEAPLKAGVANIGRRPSVNDRGVLLESNLFDYDGDLYGQRLNVMLLDYIRPEKAFDGLDALKQQIELDAAAAWAYHAKTTGLTQQD